MILLYRVFTNILYPFLFIFIFYRLLSKKEDPKRFKEKILVKYFNIKKGKNSRLIWFHAASIGEFKSIIPIIKELNNNKKHFEFLITTNTLSSGRLAVKELEKFKNIQHRFMPFDINYLMGKFLKGWGPEKIFLVDSEIWPNLILKAKQMRIPIALINARLTKRSFNRWSKIEKTASKIFKIFDLCLCSNKETKKYLEKFKAKNIKYEGNIKLMDEIYQDKINNDNDQILSKSRFWVAASVHKDEDIFCLKTHLEIKKIYKDIITIIAPRHIDRVDKIESLSKNLNLNSQILNENDIIAKNKEIIIINSFGVLQKYFKHAKSVFVGKSLINRLKENSGQNPIDAAKLNCKIYHGPYVSNFEEIYEILKNTKISKKINNHNELSSNLIFDLKDLNKKNNKIPNSIQILGKNIFTNTMLIIDNFLNDKAS